MNRPREAGVWTAAGVFLTLAALHTWPLLAPPWRQSMNHHADVQLNSWIVAWIVHALSSSPAALFDGNIFWPETGTLAYSDPLVVPALVVAPVLWLGGSPVLAFNLSTVLGLVATAMAAWWVARQWTGSGSAALVAGALAAFNVHTLTRLAHLAATHAWGLPLAWYFADSLITRPRWTIAALLALVIAATAATSLYLLAFVGLIVGVVIVTRLDAWRGVLAVAGAAVAGLLVAAPVLLPYLRLGRQGVSRPIQMVEQFSASLSGYVTTTSVVHGWWSRAWFTTDVNVLFAGAVALMLATAGLVAMSRGDAGWRRRALAGVLLSLVGIVLSLGPATSVFHWLYEHVTPLRGLRAVARFGYVFLVVIALAASVALAGLERRAARWGRLIAVAALGLVTIEAWMGTVPTVPFRGVPAIYRHVAESPGPVRLVEVPFYPPELVFENGEYVLNATAHWQPLANGYSGFTPDSYRRRTGSFWFFPEAWAIDAMQAEGFTHVMVHLERFTPGEVAAIAEAVRGRSDMRLVASDTHGHRLYRFDVSGR